VIHTSIPSPQVSYFDIGPIRIHFYALCILIGIGIAVWLSSRRLSRRGARPGIVLDVALWAVPIGIVGGRFYHVFTHPSEYFYAGANLWNIFAVWEGGLAIFGSILFGAIGAYIGCRRAGIHFVSFADALIPGLLLAQSFGRLGNYFNQELFGPPTTLPWGLQIDSTNPAFPPGLPAGTLFQPLFLYEIVWNVLGVIVLLLIERKVSMHWGRALGFYLLWYGTGRAFLESIRIDPTEFYFAGLKINEDVAILAAIVGLILIIVQTVRHRGQDPEPVYRRPALPDGEEPTEGADSAESEGAALPGGADQSESSEQSEGAEESATPRES
jgi:prolipoprotein diacylglyceryl transferase